MKHQHAGKKWKLPKMPWEWATFWGFLACVLAGGTWLYMIRHDTKADWTDVHKAMVTVLAAQQSAVAVKGAMGGYMSGSPNQFVERRTQYETAVTQLRGELNRVSKDALSTRIRELVDRAETDTDPNRWLTPDFAKAFQECTDEVAEKAR